MARKEKTGTAGGLSMPPPVEMEFDELNFAPYNPRTISAGQMAALKASLLKHGMVLALVVQRRSKEYGANVIVGGHQRVTAIRQIYAEKGWEGPTKVWCTMLDIDDAAAKQLNIGLNNIEGEFDPYKLGEMLASIRGEMTVDDVLATGFEQENIDELVRLAQPADVIASELEAEANAEGLNTFAAAVTLSIEFDTVKARDAARDYLREVSKEQKRKPGAIISEAIKLLSAAKLSRHKNGDARKADARGAGSGKKERARSAV
jgi:hypothetical protein